MMEQILKRVVAYFTLALCIPSFAFLVSVNEVEAAVFTLAAEPEEVREDGTISVTLLVDSDVAVNTFSGALQYPEDSLEPLSVSDGNSVVSIWLERPVASGGTVSFAGFVPGGFSGENGKLFNVVFRARTLGAVTLSLEEITVLRDDGEGTREPVRFQPIAIMVTEAGGSFREEVDEHSPEPFVLFESTDVEGRTQLVFAAVDKGSGMSHYEVAERRFMPRMFIRTWERVESPYVLRDQKSFHNVYVKAVDNAGNERISVFHREHLISPLESALGAIVVLLMALLTYLLWRRRHTGPR